MKKIILIAALVLFVVVGVPYVTGRVAESVSTQLVQQFNNSQAEYGRLEIKEYERGLRATKSSFSWAPPVEMAASFSGPIVYECEGTHGIISYAYQCQAKDVPTYTEFVAAQLNGVDPVTIGGEISVFGEATQTINLDAFKVTDEGGETIEVKAGKINVATDQNLEKFVISGNFGGVEMIADDGALSLKPVVLDGDLALNQHKILIGEFNLGSEGIEFSSPEEGVVRLNNLKVSSVSKEQGDSLILAYSVSADEFRQTGVGGEAGRDNVESEVYDELMFDFELSGVDMATLALITKRLQELAKASSEESLDAEQESSRNAQMLALLPEVEDLFKKGLALELDVGADYNGDRIKGELNIELLDEIGLSDLILLSVQPQSFFRKLDARLLNALPANLVERSQESANAIASSPWYKRKDNRYEIDLRMNENGISLNGQNMQVEEFLSRLSLQ